MILITGAAGFIGHSLISSLHDKYNLIGIDNFKNSEISSISEFLDKIIFFEDDINNIDSPKYYKFFKDIKYIIHTSCSQISKSITNPQEDLYNNAQSTINLLEFSKHLPNLKKFIYLSSVSIYGDNPNITENSPIDLHTPYSISKFTGEKYVKLYNKLYNTPYIILRLSNVYGYNQIPKDNRLCGVIGKFIYNMDKNLPIEIYGDGEDYRDYTFIEDVINIIDIMLENEIINNDFNISTNQKTSTNDLIKILNTYCPLKVLYKDKRDIDNVAHRKVINDKIRNIYPEFINIYEGVRLILNKEYKYEL
jgi:nucleoside-diphosphate-sugar epimerase